MKKDILIYTVVLVVLIPVCFVLLQFPPTTGLVLIIGILISAIAIARPLSLVYFWAVIGPISVVFQNIEIIPGTQQSLYGALNVVIFPALILITIIYFRQMKKGLKFLAPFSILIPVIIVSGAISGDLRMEHLRNAIGLIIFFLIGSIAVSYIKEKKDLLRLSCIMTAPAVLICLSAILDFFFFRKFAATYQFTLRPGAFTLQNPNFLCLFALIVLGVSIAYAKLTEDYFVKILWFILICMFSLTVFLSFSLSGWISAAAFFAILIALRKQKHIWLRVTIGSLLVIETALAIQVLRIHQLPQFSYIRTGGSFGIRSRIWDSVLNLIAQKPILGHSIDAGNNLQVEIGTSISSAHNIILSYLLIYGIVGFIGIAWTFWKIGKTLFRASQSSDNFLKSYGLSMFAVLASIVVFGGAHSVGFEPSYFLVFWLISLGTIGVWTHKSTEGPPQ